ncbi:hypothetical protein JB92DRAFT_3061400 [Gautieria morchelliformis]|nr:hypothetical protein JB92DRAFT_3061400 [Gautieria morchelliformis]
MADNTTEIKNLFIQLKQAYDGRKQLWVNLQAQIDEITGRQAAILDQLDDNMAHAFATLDKRGKAILKDDVSKDKEKLLRDVLEKL